MRYRGPAPDACVTIALDTLTALYHRPSGTTHLLAEPAPQLLAAIGPEPLDLDALVARLAARFDLDGDPRAAIAARLDELVAIGLIEAA